MAIWFFTTMLWEEWSLKGSSACSMPATGAPNTTEITKKIPTAPRIRPGCRSERPANLPSRPDRDGGGGAVGGEAPAGGGAGGGVGGGDADGGDGTTGTWRTRVTSGSTPRNTVAAASGSDSTVRVVVPTLTVSPW